MKVVSNLIKRNILTLLGVGIGAMTGYLYYLQIGCVSGSCAITSNPINSALYGALMGGLLFSIFKKDSKKTKK